jgi:hypothetical protein
VLEYRQHGEESGRNREWYAEFEVLTAMTIYFGEIPTFRRNK